MVTIENTEVIKLKTPEQESLLAKLLQTSTLTKTERDNVVNRIAGKLITSYDASVLITYLLATIKFRKYFSNGRKHKKAECVECKSKLCLQRYEDISSGARVWLCNYCSKEITDTNIVLVPSRKKNGTN